MVTIERLTASHINEVKSIELMEEQIQFAGTAQDFLQDKDESVLLYITKSDGHVVGFFKIDTAYPTTYEFCPSGSVGLRAFAIDKKQQGKGLGTRAVKALLAFYQGQINGDSNIYLTVNCKNPAARVCYLKSGFEDTGELYLGGPAGPQHIMRAQI